MWKATEGLWEMACQARVKPFFEKVLSPYLKSTTKINILYCR